MVCDFAHGSYLPLCVTYHIYVQLRTSDTNSSYRSGDSRAAHRYVGFRRLFFFHFFPPYLSSATLQLTAMLSQYRTQRCEISSKHHNSIECVISILSYAATIPPDLRFPHSTVRISVSVFCVALDMKFVASRQRRALRTRTPTAALCPALFTGFPLPRSDDPHDTGRHCRREEVKNSALRLHDHVIVVEMAAVGVMIVVEVGGNTSGSGRREE